MRKIQIQSNVAQQRAGAPVGGISIDGAALARQLMTPPEQQQLADVYANAVILNLLVSMLEEPPSGR